MKKRKLVPSVYRIDPVTGATSITIFDTRYDKLVTGLLIEKDDTSFSLRCADGQIVKFDIEVLPIG